jgi:hypothetical protein
MNGSAGTEKEALWNAHRKQYIPELTKKISNTHLTMPRIHRAPECKSSDIRDANSILLIAALEDAFLKIGY